MWMVDLDLDGRLHPFCFGIARMIPFCHVVDDDSKQEPDENGLERTIFVQLQLLHLVMILVKNRWIIQSWHGTPTCS
jgi:hypothetical protein